MGILKIRKIKHIIIDIPTNKTIVQLMFIYIVYEHVFNDHTILI